MKVTKTAEELVELLKSSHEHVSREIVDLHGQINDARGKYVSPDSLFYLGRDLASLDGQRMRLSLLLRVAHGMNPNGGWPHDPTKCIQCGRNVDPDADDGLCHGYACKHGYPEAYA